MSKDPEKIELLDKSHMTVQLEELHARIAALESAKATPRGNPAVVGLAGFGATTMVLQFHNMNSELVGLNPVVCLGLFFGGLAQLVAGLQEFNTGNNFGYCAFTTYGAFWISLACLVLGHEQRIITVKSHDLGYFLICFTLFTFIMFIGSLRTTFALSITFFLLFLGFVLLDVAEFRPEVKPGFKKAAGGVLFICSLMAWYNMTHLLYKDLFRRDVLPVGPPPLKIVNELMSRRRGKDAVA